VLRAVPRRSGVFRHWFIRSLSVLTLLVVAAVIVAWSYSRPPRPDEFYDAPKDLPSSPGVLVRHEPFARGLPAGARAWRILYTTTREGGTPTLASALVLAAANLLAGPRPVIAWAHGTTGVVPGCAPSVLPAPYPFEGVVPALGQVVAEGWVLVATDYAGLGTAGPHAYLVGESEARATLDAVRASRQLADLTLGDRAIVWGHSQGGHAALWTGAVAAEYAPEANVIGVAAMAPATRLTALVEAAKDSPVGMIMSSYAITAYSSAYHDVRFTDYVRPAARLLTRDMAGRCLTAPGAYFSLYETRVLGRSIFLESPSSGPLGERFEANTPRRPISVPVLIAQGEADTLVLPTIQDQFVAERCEAGQSLEYRTYAGRDHVGLVTRESALTDDLMQWTRDRLAGAPVVPGCRTVRR
jgi:pimeloyl-ACP methyl ester carboxylesterase